MNRLYPTTYEGGFYASRHTMIQQEKVSGVSPIDNGKKQSPPLTGGLRLQAEIEVDRSPELCYAFWRDVEKLPLFMNNVDSVEKIDDRRSHWIVEAPADTTVEWDAEIIEDVPRERISWRSLENAEVDNAGSVHFASLDGGTRTLVTLVLTYNPTLGVVGEALARLFGESPEQQVEEDLKRFKEAVEKRESDVEA